jgi:hypothetical protein
MLASLKEHRKERDDQGKTRKRNRKRRKYKKEPKKRKEERNTGKSFSAQSFGDGVGIEKFLTSESEAIQIFILEDPKGRNAKQDS